MVNGHHLRVHKSEEKLSRKSQLPHKTAVDMDQLNITAAVRFIDFIAASKGLF